jgi:hypothetical protein
VLYRALGRLDAYCGVSSWEEGLSWLATFEPERPVAEIQYWGHGKWGAVRVAGQRLDRSDVLADGALRPHLERVRNRLRSSEALWWFRTCEAFGGQPGHAFAHDFADFMGCRAAGHTFIIGYLQSGLHTLAAGARPEWPIDEGLLAGTPSHPEQAKTSGWREPNTITCMRGAIPSGY